MSAFAPGEAALEINVRPPSVRPKLTTALAILAIVIAAAAVLGTLAGAIADFTTNLSITGGVVLIVMAVVFATVLGVPAVVFLRRLLRPTPTGRLVIDSGGFSFVSGGQVVARLRWEQVADVRLVRPRGRSGERLVVFVPRPRSMVALRGMGNDAWFSARLRDMDVDRGKLAEAIRRSSNGRYQPL